MKFVQTDERWGELEQAPGVKVKDYGCLITALANILVCFSEFYYITPGVLFSFLQGSKGFTSEGWVVWQPILNYFSAKYKKYTKETYKDLSFSNSDKIWYIVQVKYKNTGHFCMVTGFKNGVVEYYDSYDGKTKYEKLDNCISIRELIFE